MAERQATITSGEMYPDRGMPESSRLTRFFVDERKFGNVGNGMACKVSHCSCGADPPKNESGITAIALSCSDAARVIVSSTGNGSSIAGTNVSIFQPGIT